MKFKLIKKFNWIENERTGTEENVVCGFNYSNMGEFLVIRWDLEEFKKNFPEEMSNLEVIEEYTKVY